MKSKLLFLFAFISCLFLLSGCSHTHEFSAATCTSPAICSECGETKGKPLGHTTAVGTCSNCNEIQNKALMDTINLDITSADGQINIFLEYLPDTVDEYKYFSDTGIEMANSYLSDAIDCCADYEELSSLKKALQKTIDTTPELAGYSLEDINGYLTGLKDYCTVFSSVQIEALKIK